MVDILAVHILAVGSLAARQPVVDILVAHILAVGTLEAHTLAVDNPVVRSLAVRSLAVGSPAVRSLAEDSPVAHNLVVDIHNQADTGIPLVGNHIPVAPDMVAVELPVVGDCQKLACR